MSVLTLGGKPVDWANPPSSISRVRWSQLTSTRNPYPVTGSLFVIAWLDWADAKARAKFGVGISVIQPPFNDTVEASAGTHDFDYCLDVWINGVSGLEQQRFFRFECGAAMWLRTPAQGFSYHCHGFPLPPNGRSFPTKVGVFVDGGRSQGKSGYTSQLDDYWAEAYGLKNLHYQSADPTPFPSDAAKMAGIFDLQDYIRKQKELNDDMGYKDWSAEDKKAFWADASTFLKSEPVEVQVTKGKKKKIPFINALARAAAADTDKE